MSADDDVLVRAWDDAADGYEQYFVPRFRPWVDDAVGAVAGRDLPDGAIVVPCCGTFPELEPLAAVHAGREIVGIDLSPRMIELASARARGVPGARAVVGDALELPDAAAIVSVFGLQQLPDPADALRRWTAALRPGGVASVVFWPATVETTGPFAVMAKLFDRPPPAEWEQRLRVTLEDAGAELIADGLITHRMQHDDAATFWAASTTSGPMRATVLRRGEDYVASRRSAFLEAAPAGVWRHEPAARHVVFRRAAA